MSEEFGSNFVTIVDDDGDEIELEHLDTAMHNDKEYMAFIPADTAEDAEETELLILRVEEDGDEEMLETIEDEDELQAVYEVFMARLQDDEE